MAKSPRPKVIIYPPAKVDFDKPFVVEQWGRIVSALEARRGGSATTFGGAFAHAAGLTSAEDYEGWWPLAGIAFRYGYPLVKDFQKAGAAIMGALDQLHTWLGGAGSAIAHGEAILAQDAQSAAQALGAALGWSGPSITAAGATSGGKISSPPTETAPPPTQPPKGRPPADGLVFPDARGNCPEGYHLARVPLGVSGEGVWACLADQIWV
jgi:hypothetical protein